MRLGRKRTYQSQMEKKAKAGDDEITLWNKSDVDKIKCDMY